MPKERKERIKYKGTIINPEAIENASRNFTDLIIKLYNECKLSICKDADNKSITKGKE